MKLFHCFAEGSVRCRSAFLLLIALGALGLALGPARARQQDPPQARPPEDEVISLETNLVVLNVTITDLKDRYVAGLKAEDFKVIEENRPQEIVSLGFEETPFTAAILLDASASMESKLTLERAACTSFVDGIREGDTFAIYGFGDSKVKKLQDFTEIRDIPESVWDLRAEGKTPLFDAMIQATEDLANRSERRRALLVVSDGADTQSRSSLEQVLRRAIAAHTAIYAIDMSGTPVNGAGPRNPGVEILKTVTSKTGGRFFRTPGGSQLREAFASTVDELRHQYTITYESSNDRQDGRWRPIEVRVARPNLNIRTRQGYYARKKKSGKVQRSLEKSGKSLDFSRLSRTSPD